mmetsp:Transcript_139522/g.197540  ORF Transcript_139522/g.197540 Transcript_139522/m.197540 type:complete len:227 (-) Transcript_139522:54-734(-)
MRRTMKMHLGFSERSSSKYPRKVCFGLNFLASRRCSCSKWCSIWPLRVLSTSSLALALALLEADAEAELLGVGVELALALLLALADAEGDAELLADADADALLDGLLLALALALGLGLGDGMGSITTYDPSVVADTVPCRPVKSVPVTENKAVPSGVDTVTDNTARTRPSGCSITLVPATPWIVPDAVFRVSTGVASTTIVSPGRARVGSPLRLDSIVTRLNAGAV